MIRKSRTYDARYPPADPILKRLRAALDELYGERIERVVLFGSLARGEAEEDLDYDVAVFLWDLREDDRANRCTSSIASRTCAAKPSPTPVFSRCRALPGRRLSQSDRTDERNSPRGHRSVTPEIGYGTVLYPATIEPRISTESPLPLLASVVPPLPKLVGPVNPV